MASKYRTVGENMVSSKRISFTIMENVKIPMS